MSNTTLDSPYLEKFQEKSTIYAKVDNLATTPSYQGLEQLSKLAEEYDDDHIAQARDVMKDQLYTKAKLNRMLHLSKRGGPNAKKTN